MVKLDYLLSKFIRRAVFGYEGQTNDLKVISKGSDGIEEMTEDLNSGKIMYAFLKVNDPKTSLPKCVLINWQGEGANIVRKGLCANHVRDVGNFFSGAHVTLNARNEEEIEPQLIIDKVAKAGSAYSFKAPRSDDIGPTGPIGSNYQRINPIKEINSKERDTFWMKEEEEEKKRVAEERKRFEAEKLRLEQERKKREIVEEQQREAKSEQRNENITMIKEAEKFAFESTKKEESYFEEEAPAVNKSDELRRIRNQEAQELISKRTIDARSIFEQNTVAGQMKRTPEKPIRTSLAKNTNPPPTQEPVQEIRTPLTDLKAPEEPQSDEEADQFSTIKRSPKDAQETKKVDQSPLAKEIEVIQNEFAVTATDKLIQREVEQVIHITEQQLVDEVIYQDFSTGPGLQARALYDYQAGK